MKLTVPWEENMEVAHKRKMTKYDTLSKEIEKKGRRYKVLFIEMGCRGYSSRDLISFPESASNWIWQAPQLCK